MNNNIQESYCSFEVSKLLKEKGLISHGAAYTLDGEFFINSNLLNQSITGKPKPEFINTVTHALAIEWIRVNFGIWIMVDCASTDFWFPKIIKTSDGSFAVHTVEITHPKEKSHPKGKFDTPQEATEAALLYILQKLIP